MKDILFEIFQKLNGQELLTLKYTVNDEIRDMTITMHTSLGTLYYLFENATNVELI